LVNSNKDEYTVVLTFEDQQLHTDNLHYIYSLGWNKFLFKDLK